MTVSEMNGLPCFSVAGRYSAPHRQTHNKGQTQRDAPLELPLGPFYTHLPSIKFNLDREREKERLRGREDPGGMERVVGIGEGREAGKESRKEERWRCR